MKSAVLIMKGLIFDIELPPLSEARRRGSPLRDAADEVRRQCLQDGRRRGARQGLNSIHFRDLTKIFTKKFTKIFTKQLSKFILKNFKNINSMRSWYTSPFQIWVLDDFCEDFREDSKCI